MSSRPPSCVVRVVPELPTGDSILIAHHDPLARRLLRAVAGRAGLEVVAEAGDGPEALALVSALQPDLVLIDLLLPEVDGIETTFRIHAQRPSTTVIVLTPCDDDDRGIDALRCGASGYVSRDLEPERLPRVLHAALAGEPAISRRLARRLVDHVRELRPDARGMRPVRSDLTDREWEVLDLLADGGTTEAIADDLLVSAETVRSHVKAILRKLHVSSRAEAVGAARRLRSDPAPLRRPLAA